MSAKLPLLHSFQGPWRRVFYVTLYEGLAIIFVTVVMLIGRRDLPTADGLAVGSSTIAVIWNWIFNALFERWEGRQSVRGRSVGRRIMHAIGFEGGLRSGSFPSWPGGFPSAGRTGNSRPTLRVSVAAFR